MYKNYINIYFLFILLLISINIFLIYFTFKNVAELKLLEEVAILFPLHYVK